MIKEYFKKLRFNDKHHSDLGDIRLTIGQQKEIVQMFKEKVGQIEAIVMPKTVDKLVAELQEETMQFLYIENYTHEGEACYKIDNPFTYFVKETVVVGKVSDGIKPALRTAIREIKRRKAEFLT